MTSPAVQLDSANVARINRNLDRMASKGATSEEMERYLRSEELSPADSTPAASGGDPARVKRNFAKLKAAGASQEEIERYLRSEGAMPVDEQPAHFPDNALETAYPTAIPSQEVQTDTNGFRGKGAGGSTKPVPLGEGLGRSFAQGLTLGWSDELRGALAAPLESLRKGKSLGQAYRDVRDEERAGLRTFAQDHPVLAGGAEIAGDLVPSTAAGPLKWLKGQQGANHACG